MKIISLLLSFIIFALFTINLNAQGLYLRNKKKEIYLSEGSCIGLTTSKDTINYYRYNDSSYHIFKTGKDSLIIRKWYKNDDKSSIGYDYRSFALKDITSVNYPINDKADGCVGCLLIPGLNIWYLIDSHNRKKAKNVDMNKWTFSFK